jgi:hypothetical protein
MTQVIKSRYLNRQKSKKNYETQFSTTSIMKGEIEKNQLKTGPKEIAQVNLS